MPYQPRKYSTTTGLPPELLAQSRVEHQPIPIKLGAKQDEDRPARLKLGLETLSPRRYEPNYKLLYKSLLGKEPEIDPYTGRLVHSPGSNTQSRSGPQQAGPAQSQ